MKENRPETIEDLVDPDKFDEMREIIKTARRRDLEHYLKSPFRDKPMEV